MEKAAIPRAAVAAGDRPDRFETIAAEAGAATAIRGIIIDGNRMRSAVLVALLALPPVLPLVLRAAKLRVFVAARFILRVRYRFLSIDTYPRVCPTHPVVNQ